MPKVDHSNMEHRIVRALTCYSNADDKIVFNVQFEGFDLAAFQEIFGVDSGNPMYDSYQVNDYNGSFLQQYLPKVQRINWDFNNCAYFIEAVEC